MEKFFGGLVKAGWKALLLVFVIVAIAASVHWAQHNSNQAQATGDKVIGAAASGIGWAADSFTNMTGGSADTVRGSGGRLIWVQDEAPGYWPVRQAVANWNKGLTTVHLSPR